MWLINDLTVLRTTVPSPCFDGSHQILTATVFSGETCLISAVTHCDFTADPCQLLVCECGQIGCASGGWVSFRRAGPFVLLIPAFQRLSAHDEFERTEYSSPEYMTDSDMTAAISESRYSSLRKDVPELLDTFAIQSLSIAEAIRITQLQAPLQVLGRFPDKPKLNKELILAVTDGDLTTEVSQIDQFLTGAAESTAPVEVIASASNFREVEFHLDGHRIPAWSAFHKSAQGFAVTLTPIGQFYLGSHRGAD